MRSQGDSVQIIKFPLWNQILFTPHTILTRASRTRSVFTQGIVLERLGFTSRNGCKRGGSC